MWTGATGRRALSDTPPWLAPPPPADDLSAVTVLGAGIAGASVARALAERGSRVRVIDRAGPAGGASGHPAAVIRPLLARSGADPLARFVTAASRAAIASVEALRERGHRIDGAFDGVLHCHRDATALVGDTPHAVLDREHAAARVGAPLRLGGVWLAAAGWVDPVGWCRALLDHPRIDCELAEVRAIAHDGWRWQLDADTDLAPASALVIATGAALGRFAPLRALPIAPNAGVLLRTADTLARPRAPVVGGVTLCPTASGWLVAGGNTRADTAAPALDGQLVERATELWSASLPTADRRHAVRATTPDYLPVVGAVPDFALAAEAYADLHHGRAAHHYPEPPWLPDAWLIGGLGGRGMSTAAQCAQALVAQMHGETTTHGTELHPLRFLARRLRRGLTPWPVDLD